MKFCFVVVVMIMILFVGLVFVQIFLLILVLMFVFVVVLVMVVMLLVFVLSVFKVWVLMDYVIGQVLVGENVNVQLVLVSIIKVMILYVIVVEVKNGKVCFDDQVMMIECVWCEGGVGIDGSYSGFLVNQIVCLEDMEKGMVIQFGNDVVIVLVEYVVGSEEVFVLLMNSYVVKIGMKDLYFVNVYGLSVLGYYSIVYDLVLLGCVMVCDYLEIYVYNKVKEFIVGNIIQFNCNLLLWCDQSVDGIKIGYIFEVGYCLMSLVQCGDQCLIVVVLGGSLEKQCVDDSLVLLNWGFCFFEMYCMYEFGKVVVEYKVWKGKVDNVQLGVVQLLLVSVLCGCYNDLKLSIDVFKMLEVLFIVGQQIGMLKVMLDGKVVVQVLLVVVVVVEEVGFFKCLWDSFWMWWELE